MRTKDRKRQIKQYKTKLKLVSNYYKVRENTYANEIKRLKTDLEHSEKREREIFHNLYTCEKAVLAFAGYLKRTKNYKAYDELDKMFNLHDTTCPTKKERERRRKRK